jgi:hypothetical protein
MTARQRWLPAALIPAALICAAGMAAAQTAPGPAPAPTARTFELPAVDELTATRERPLFNPSRRPPEIVVAPDAPTPITEAASLPYDLTGIARGDDVRIAILHNKTTNEELRLREGDKLEDWMLESVADRFILLRAEGRRVRVWLFDNAKKPGVDVRRTGEEEGEAEESSAAAVPDAEVDQEVLPHAGALPRMPTPAALPPPVLKRAQRPPAAARNAPMVRPDQSQRQQQQRARRIN